MSRVNTYEIIYVVQTVNGMKAYQAKLKQEVFYTFFF